MHPPNDHKILGLLKDTDVVLDIGGWACPYNRANYILDAEAYETRGYYKTVGLPGSQGGEREYFTRDTWIQRDICDKEPFPFADKMFDFVICSHTLEDIRDPLWVCSEILRVGKRGYIEIPSRLVESCRGWESHKTVGLTHHRWLIDVDQKASHIRFLHKHHMIHAEQRFSFPPSFLRTLTDEQRVSYLFWNDTFSVSESSIHGMDNIASELEQFIQKSYQYSAWKVATDKIKRRAGSVVRRITRS
jgi:SAM-dependent methyltransferase